MIRLTDADAIEPDDPIYVDPSQVAVLQVNRSRADGGTIITLAGTGAMVSVQEDIEAVKLAMDAVYGK